MPSFLVTIGLLAVAICSFAVADEVVFGQSASFSGGAWEPGEPFNTGLLAAFHEINTNGGVQNRTIRLISLDDQYDVQQVRPNVEALLAMPEVFALVSLMGSPTVTEALPLVAAAKMPLIGPLTGSAVFRKIHNPWTINVRAGYDDEALAMLRLLVTEMQLQRISLIYQNDAFGAPAMEIIVAAMAQMRLPLTSIYKYYRPLIPTYNFTEWALNLLADRPQGIILYTVEGFSNPFLTEFYKLMSDRVVFVTGSWIGDANMLHLKQHGLDPTLFHMTQVVPPPLSDLNITKRYRAAVVAYKGAATATFDYLGFEGYIIGRMIVEALRRTPVLDRAEFLRTIYETRMFSFEELLAGPFSNDCAHDPGTAATRSSLCYCNQGMRFVSTTRLNSNYDYVSAAGDMVYPITECYAPLDIVRRPVMLALVQSLSAPMELQTASAKLGVGIALDTAMGASTRDLVVDDKNSAYPNATAAALLALGDNSLMLGGIGLTPVAPQLVYPVFPLIGKLRLADRSFHRTTIHLLATIQQQIHSIAEHVAGRSGRVTLVIDTASSAEENDVGETIETVLRRSLRSFDRHLDATLTFGNNVIAGNSVPTFADVLTRDGASLRNVVIVGLDSASQLHALVHYLTNTTAGSDARAYMLFHEAAAHFDDLLSSTADDGLLARMLFATNLPLWTSNGELPSQFKTLMAYHGLSDSARNPLYFVGYFFARVVEFVKIRSDGDASAATFLQQLYQTSLLSVGGVALGPFIDGECNAGVRAVSVFSFRQVTTGDDSNASHTRFTQCHVVYTEPTREEKSDHTVAITCGVLFPVLLAAVCAAYLYMQHRTVMYAPKDNLRFYSMFVVLKQETLLWERRGDSMPQVMKKYHRIVDDVAFRCECYVAKHIGGATLIVATLPEQILRCAAELNETLQHTEWNIMEGPSVSIGVGRHQSVTDSERSSHVERSATQSSAGVTRQASDFDRRSHTSRSSAGSSSRQNVAIHFAIGVHFDRGLVKKEESRHAYSYSGPSVDGAAMASDRACGDQILVTNAVPVLPAQAENFIEFCASDWGKDTILLQFNPPGTPLRYFSNEDDQDSANVDSVAAALEQQSAGVTQKKVTVASIFLHQLEERARAMPRDAFARLYAEKLNELAQVVKEEKGYIHSFVGPRVVVSFNAAAPTPQATMRAFAVVERVRALENRDNGGEISAGIASDFAIVGAFKTASSSVVHDALVSRVAETASLLQRMCELYPSAHCLAQGTMYDELTCFAFTEIIDLVAFPGTAKPKLLLAVHQFKVQSEDDCEWMYGLAASAADSYYMTNTIFEHVVNSSNPHEDLSRLLDDIPEEFHEQEGYMNLKKVTEFVMAATAAKDPPNGSHVEMKEEGLKAYLGSKGRN